MAKIFAHLLCLLILIPALTQHSQAQITVTGSNGLDGTYASFSLAGGFFATVNAGGSQAGYNISVSITSDITTETGANSLTDKGWTSMTITPSGNRTVGGTSSAGAAIVGLNGADNVTIDGLNDGTNSLTIYNASTSSTAGTSTIRFINDASNNTITNCTITGGTTGASTANVLFSTTSGTTGNDDNLISDCNVTMRSGNRPVNGLLSSGTSAKLNSGNTVSDCNFYDLLPVQHSLDCNAIYLASYNDNWTISGNSFYNSNAYVTMSTNYTLRFIYITSGDDHTISGNYIGGSSANCGGSAYTKTNSTANEVIGIDLSVGTTTATGVQGNTIQNITWNNSATAKNFTGINITAGKVNLGTTTGNIIGNSAGTGSINFTPGTASLFYGIKLASSSACSIENNTIAAIIAAANAQFYGIHASGMGAVAYTINGNTIGSGTSNSVDIQSNKTNYGIYITYATAPSALSVNNNRLQRIYASSTGTSQKFFGLYYDNQVSTTGSFTFNNNLFLNIKSESNYSATLDPSLAAMYLGCDPSAYGYYFGSHTISGNLMDTIILNSTGNYYGFLAGFYFPYISSSGTQHGFDLKNNKIYNLECKHAATGGNKPSLYGIYYRPNSGSSARRAAFYNNTIIISNGGNTNNCNIIGMYAYANATTASTSNVYHNTIMVSGTSANTTNAYCIYIADGSGSPSVQNNLFQNTRSGGTLSRFAVYDPGGDATYGYNYIETSANPVAYYGGANRTFVQWQAIDAQALTGTIILGYHGNVSSATTSDVMNTGTNLFATVGTDIDGNSRTNGSATIPGGPYTGPWRGAYETGTALPVSLISFTAQAMENSVLLSWSCSSETNNDFFFLEHSVDGLSFAAIGNVAGAGTTLSPTSYSFSHENPQPGYNYYRLKQTDFDGKTDILGIRVVKFGPSSTEESGITVFPNPAYHSHFSVVNMQPLEPRTEVLVSVTDALQREFFSKVIITDETGNFFLAIDPASQITPGVYWVTCSTVSKMYSEILVVR